jgi:hypothetical protein
MIRIAIVFFIFSLTIGCSPKITSRLATAADIEIISPHTEDGKKISPCYDPLSYVAYPELIRTKYIRVNVHFMNSADGRHNMPQEETAAYAKEWIMATNSNLDHNMKMFLPHGNETAVLPIPYRYVISADPSVPGDNGIYYHVDDELCFAVKQGRDRNISDKRVITKYAIRNDSVLNIFMQTHHLDSIPSPTYSASTNGISMGSSVKIFGQWHKKPSVWDIRGIVNHELGHSLGLAHTWGGNDGCDDTPNHPNCWNKTDTPPCDTMYSNNMMDYNAHMAALTPCQIGKILMNMARPGTIQRSIVEARWCTLDTTANITVNDSMRLEGAYDCEGNILIESGGTLEIACRLSMAEGATITIKPGGKLTVLPTGIIHNACDGTWAGIHLVQERKKTGRLEVVKGGKIENTIQPLVMEP